MEPGSNNIALVCVNEDASVFEILERQEQATSRGMPGGIAIVVDGAGKLIGTITDGDIRRALLKEKGTELLATDIMKREPVFFSEQATFQDILEQLPDELAKRNRKSSRFLSKIILVDIDRKPVRVLDYHQLWEQRVATHRHIVVVGLGYVGLTLALALANEGFQVTGFDVEVGKVDDLNDGNSYVHEQGLPELLREQIGKNFRASANLPENGDVYVISVGTPVSRQNGGQPVPSLDYLLKATEAIGKKLKPGNLVILRSTVPVGTCRDTVAPLLEKVSGLECGKDFHLSFAPERTAEGKAIQELRQLPQIIGGVNADSVEATVALFRDLTPTIIRVDSLEAAEMAKLINNSFRDLVFSFSNQVAQVAAHFNIDIVEVINAANEGYPRDKVPLPSPGVGGPCLTKDPYIFASVAENSGQQATLFKHGREINESMHRHVADRMVAQLETLGKDPAACSLLVCGLAFKGEPETGDIRDSSALAIIDLLKGRVKHIHGHDPVATKEEIRQFNISPVEIPAGFEHMDAVLFLNNHKSYEKTDVYFMVRAMNEKPVIFDGWHLFRPQDILQAAPCIYMGLSFVRSSVV